jgi:tetratricopeptide (TPR) repeat protein
MIGRSSNPACLKCGRLVPHGAGFCPNCGTQFGETSYAVETTDPDTTLPGANPTNPGAGPTIATELGLATSPEAQTISPTAMVTSLDSPSPRPPVRADDGPFQPGQQVGPRYTIIKLLGTGGMGAVYQAFDHELGVAVAIKVIRPAAQSDATAAKDLENRFKRELVLARQVTHKYVVRIHDLGELNGIKYLTMPFVEGETLAQLLRKTKTLPLARAIQIATQVAQGLEAAHDKGVIHRDLKPENIMIEKATESPIATGGDALIMDFGIARSMSTGGTQTAAGSVIGTLEYMAPEQAQGAKVDQRADQYAFGLIMYDMLVGRQRLSKRENAMTELLSRLASAPPAPRQINPEIPEAVDQLVMRCLQPSADARYPTTADLVKALEQLTPDGHIRTDVHEVVREVPGRLKWQLAAAGILIVVLGAAAGWVISNRTGGPGAATAAPREPVSVLIADFDNKTGDPVFDGVVEQAITLGIEGASFVTAYPRRDALRAAATIKPGSKLDEATARLVALREGVSTVVTGAIEPKGSGYHITIKGVGPGTDGAVRYTLEDDADGKAQVLATVGALAGQVRVALGDTVAPAANDAFTAASLEAASAFSAAQELQAAGRRDDAIKKYQEAIGLDPDFGRAYSGIAVQYEGLGRFADAEKNYKEALSRIDRMNDREKYRTQGLYYLFARKPDQAAEQFTTLLAAYPFDNAGLTNLTLARFYLREFPQAVEQGRKVVALQPNNIGRRSNLSLYAMYAGQFENAITESNEALKMNPATLKAFVARALSELALGRPADAIKTYEALAKTSPDGASYAAAGLADVALIEGRFADAIGLLDKGIAGDTQQKNLSRAANKRVARAEVLLARGDTAGAVREAQAAMAATADIPVQSAAGLLLARAGRRDDAAKAAAALENKLEADPQAYAKLIRAEVALAQGQARPAVDFAREAGKLANTWLGRVTLGRAYLELGEFPEAYSELEAALKRQGEATAIFLDDVPSYRHFPPVHYYLGRAQEGLKSAGAAQSYKTFLSLMKSGEPATGLVADARSRLSKLGS